MARATAAKEPSMSEVLSNLELDNEEDPETAAERAVSRMNEGKNESSGIEVPPPRDDEGASEDDGEGEDEEDNTPIPPAVVPPPASLAPVASLGPKGKKSGRNTSPSAKKLGILSMKAPGAEKVKVSKRDEKTGELYFVHDYTALDIDRFSDYESFIKRYIEPEHGAGEYELTAVDATNREWALGTIRLIKRPTPQGPESSVLQLLQQGREMQEQHLSRLEKTMQQPAQKDPLEVLQGVMRVQEQLEQKNGAGRQDATAVMLAAMQQSTALLTAALSKPKDPDPLLPVLVELLRDKNNNSSAALPPPPPPPPPPTSILEKLDIPTTLTAITGFIVAIAPLLARKEDNSNQVLLTYLMKKADDKDQISTKDMIEMLQKERESAAGGGDDLMATIDKLAAVMNLAKNMDSGQQSQTSFMDALASLLGNRDLGAGIARLMSSKLGGAAQQPPPAAVQQLQQREAAVRQAAQQIQQAQQQIHSERVALEAEKRRLSSGEAASEPVQETSPSAQTAAPTSERVQQATEKMQAAHGKVPELPAQTKEFLDEIEKSSDEASLGKALVDLLVYFHGHPPIWRGFVDDIFAAMRDENAAKTLKYLHAAFDTFTQKEMLSVDAANRVLKMVRVNTTVFKQLLDGVRLDKDEQVTGAALVSDPASA